MSPMLLLRNLFKITNEADDLHAVMVVYEEFCRIEAELIAIKKIKEDNRKGGEK